jgi:alanine racemase
MRFTDLKRIVTGQMIQLSDPDRELRFLMTDSRSAMIGPGTVFFAIRGPHHDGHNFISALYARGCRQFVVEQPPSLTSADVNIYLAEDTIQALQELSAAHRQHFDIPLVGITGSNGKTIVKEWLGQLLGKAYKVVKNPKSYNSQIGVPLSIWHINAQHDMGIFEAGISLPGEMEKLQAAMQPNLGIFTNIGPAHDEGFISWQQKADEKAMLFKESSKIIYCRDYPEIDNSLKKVYASDKLVSWSKQKGQEINWHVQYSINPKGTLTVSLKGGDKQQEYAFFFPYSDEASRENITHCIVFLLEMHWDSVKIQSGLQSLGQVSMRMELKKGVNGCYLLDDSYSNDLAGLEIALNHLVQQAPNEHTTVILSDLLQTSQDAHSLYSEILTLLKAFSLNKLILIGPESQRHRNLFEKQGWEFQHFSDTDAFLSQLQPDTFRHENILVKGARVFGFEKIVTRLQQQIHTTRLEINLDAITHNLNVYRAHLSKHTRIMVMVKAFSYGGAAFEIAHLLQYHLVDYLAVAYADEGIMLREHGIRLPILVLNPTPQSFEQMVTYQLEPEIYTLSLLKAWEATHHGELPIHLKLDTGMHRLGFMKDEIPALLDFLKAYPHINVRSIFTHLVASEDTSEDYFTHQQIQRFESMYHQVSSVLGYQPLRHVLNSAGIARFSAYQMDMVRLGLGLYGVDTSGSLPQLLPISQLKTSISQIKQLDAGESVGYNRAGKVDTPKKIATLAIGYADGLDRRLGNGKLQVWIHGKPAPTIGNICMDMTMVDISGIEAQEGDEALIFGREQGVDALARAMGTIPYEVLTGISERVKRVFFANT